MLAPLLTFGFVACNDTTPTDPMPDVERDIVDIVLESNDFNTLEAALVQADLVATLQGPGPFTVFAPNDAAFSAYLSDNNLEANDLLNSPALGDVLTYHVLSGAVTSGQLSAGAQGTVNGADLYLSEDPEGNWWINGNTRIIDADITASNGVIHVLDYVIVPPSQTIAEIAVDATEGDSPEFTQLVGALQRADLVGAVNDSEANYTVFAPTDAAFQALYDALGVNGYEDIPLETLTAVLTAHVVPSRAFSQDLRQGAELPTLNSDATLTVDLSALTVGGANLNADMLNILATNGVIHVINDVIVP
ncbi:fasciclin domain-containing protein [Litoribacter ruber]|uniref:Fasciclin domain-containing protein n=2 Tax=Litoribacter ruber TaxID=702568 RepID=A0AAP2G4Z2_9BACT|nr:fasciclin domain-containing protein [Litoribacter alkaliphilus]MBT0811836.1 fasciclin domain-containing protein [Litoribacter ruber]